MTTRVLSRFGIARSSRQRRVRPGQAMVEMALVMMLLLVLVFGIIDFGLYFYRHVEAANCVREAARRKVVDDTTTAPLCVGGLAPSVSVVDGDAVATISVTHDWIVIDHFIPGLGGVTVGATTRMRLES